MLSYKIVYTWLDDGTIKKNYTEIINPGNCITQEETILDNTDIYFGEYFIPPSKEAIIKYEPNEFNLPCITILTIDSNNHTNIIYSTKRIMPTDIVEGCLDEDFLLDYATLE